MRTLPLWVEAMLVTVFIVAIICLAIYLAAAAINSIINAKSKLEELRSRSEVEALNRWKELYEDERDARRADNSALIEQIGDLADRNATLEKQLKDKDDLLKRTKVKDLEVAV